jgi:hypothetical protein
VSGSQTEGGAKVSLWTSGELKSEIKLDDECTSLNTQKTMGSCSGTWSLTLQPRLSGGEPVAGDIRKLAHVYQAVRPNNVISLGFQERGGIMLGLVDACFEGISYVGKRPSKTLTLRGRDFGKGLENDNIVFPSLTVEEQPAFLAAVAAAWGSDHPLLRQLPGCWGPSGRDVDQAKAFLAVGVDEVVEWVLSNTGTLMIPLLKTITGGSGRITDYMNLAESVNTWNDGRVYNDELTSFQGSIWGFLTSMLDLDFYEIFIDTLPAARDGGLPFPCLVIRPKPFDEAQTEFLPVEEQTGTTWEDLKTLLGPVGLAAAKQSNWEVPLERMFTSQLGWSDSDAYAFYLVTAVNELIGNAQQAQDGLIYPVVDTFIGGESGIKSMNARVSLVAADVGAKREGGMDYGDEIPTTVKEFRNRLINWNRMNSYFESGSISCAGNDHFRIGDPILLPWRESYMLPATLVGRAKGMRYYCSSVSQSWTLGGPYTSSLTLSRGHNSDMVQAFKQRVLLGAPPSNPSHLAVT